MARCLHCLSASFAFPTREGTQRRYQRAQSPLPFGFVRFPDKFIIKLIFELVIKLSPLPFGFVRFPDLRAALGEIFIKEVSIAFRLRSLSRHSVRFITATKEQKVSPLPFGFVRFPDVSPAKVTRSGDGRSPLPFGFVRFPDISVATQLPETLAKSPLPFGFVRFPDTPQMRGTDFPTSGVSIAFRLRSLSRQDLCPYYDQVEPEIVSIAFRLRSLSRQGLRWLNRQTGQVESPLPFGFVRFPDNG